MLKAVFSDEILAERSTPTTMLVLDDEADNASVLDSFASQKITPRFIAALWSGDHQNSASRSPKLLGSYVAYTATPQANFLQETHNPLAPRHFSAALRVAGQSGAALPRELTYTEPRGLKGYYCGGDIYYEELASLAHPLAVPFDFPERGVNETEEQHALKVCPSTMGNDLSRDAPLLRRRSSTASCLTAAVSAANARLPLPHPKRPGPQSRAYNAVSPIGAQGSPLLGRGRASQYGRAR